MSDTTDRAELGSRENPFTHDTRNMGYRWCKCSACGETHRCVPSFDFYITGAQMDGTTGLPLTCERCFRSALHGRGIRTDLLGPVVGGDPS